MSVRQRLAAFAAVLGLAFTLGWGVGHAVGPVDDPSTGSTPASDPAHTGHGGGHP